MPKLKLSIIILNYKTKHLLRLVLKNLLQLNIAVPYEIIVIDNASHDGSVEMVKSLYGQYAQIHLIASAENTGHARGNNLGIREAKGEYLLIMNTDIIFFEQAAILNILQYLDTHPEVAILGPKLLNGDGSVQNSCFRPYSTFTPVYRRTPLGKFGWAKRDLERHLMSDFDHSSIQDIDWILGAVLFVRKDVVDRVGSFSEEFFLYFADFELCDRVRRYGYKVRYYPDVSIVHYHRRESAQGSIWGGLGSLFNYTTRIHLKDWMKYRRMVKRNSH